MDHTLNGKQLPDNIFWVGAMNPLISIKNNEEKRKEGEKFNFTGVASDTNMYEVRPIPESMDEIVLDFKEFKPDQEESFLNVLLSIQSRESQSFAAVLQTQLQLKSNECELEALKKEQLLLDKEAKT
jgi:hypothetical protein